MRNKMIQFINDTIKTFNETYNNTTTNNDKTLGELLKTDLLWLVILIGILVSLAIIATIYKIITYRKMSIVSKKIDYLVEDIIYKTEYITPTIEAIVKLSNYVDLVENVVKKNSSSLIKYVSNNKKSINKISKQLKELIKQKQ